MENVFMTKEKLSVIRLPVPFKCSEFYYSDEYDHLVRVVIFQDYKQEKENVIRLYSEVEYI
jgi:hypothetical protein